MDYMDFADRGAKRYVRIGQGRYSYDELKSAAFHGLVEAARGFDSSRGVQFTTYAFPKIDRRLRQVHRLHKRQNGWTWNHLGDLRKSKNGEKPKGMERVAFFEAWPVNENGDEIEFRGPSVDLDEDIERQRRREKALATTVNERERLILERMLDGSTLSAIGSELGVTRSRIQQIAEKVIARAQSQLSPNASTN